MKQDTLEKQFSPEEWLLRKERVVLNRKNVVNKQTIAQLKAGSTHLSEQQRQDAIAMLERLSSDVEQRIRKLDEESEKFVKELR